MRKRLFQKGVVALTSILVTVVLLEIAVRLFVPITDFPYYASTSLGLQRIPNQRGQTVIGLGRWIRQYSINAQGWNSPQDYLPVPDNIKLIAVMGDSFVEALQVNPGDAFPDLLDGELSQLGCTETITYRFGTGGAPLSHYVGLITPLSEMYKPEAVVINIASNDFVESLAGHEPWGPYYWRVQRTNDSYELVPPVPLYSDPRIQQLDKWFALRRLLVYNLYLPGRLRLIFTGSYVPPEIAEPGPEDDIDSAIWWMLGEMQRRAQQQGVKLLLVAQPDMPSLYRGEPDPRYAYQKVVEEAARELDIEYLDLTEAFRAAYAVDGQRFEVPGDQHWDEHGHQVVAQAVARFIYPAICAAD